MIARRLDMDPARVADHLAESIENVQAALAYPPAHATPTATPRDSPRAYTIEKRTVMDGEMPEVVKARLAEKDQERLRQLASSYGVPVEEAAARLLREKVREQAFPQLEFRDSAAGRQIYIKGHRLTVWQVAMIARHLDMDPARVADHLAERIENVQAVLAYAAAYPEEIDPIVDQVTALRFDDVKRMIPGLIDLRV